MEYKTQDGEPTTLYRLVRSEPDWAVSRIAHANEEIESLLKDKEHLLAVCEDRRLEVNRLRDQIGLIEECAKETAGFVKNCVDERDEWKRRLQEYKEMVESLPGSVLVPGDGIAPYPLESVSYHEAVRRKYPEVKSWFEEE